MATDAEVGGLIPFHFKVDTYEQAGEALGLQGERRKKNLYQEFPEMVSDPCCLFIPRQKKGAIFPCKSNAFKNRLFLDKSFSFILDSQYYLIANLKKRRQKLEIQYIYQLTVVFS
jgi:hypothetical protein